MAHPNAELARRIGDALSKGDMETFFAGHTPDVIVHIAGQGPGAGDHKGLGEFQAVFGEMAGILDAPPAWETHDVLANDEHAIALGVQTFIRGGKTVATPVVVVAHVTGGKFSEVWVTPAKQHELGALLG